MRFSRPTCVLRISGLVLGLIASPTALAQVPPTSGCQPEWVPGFGGSSGLDSSVYSMHVFDDGSGPALYAGGGFSHAGGMPATRIARWNGYYWAGVGAGMNFGDVYTMAGADLGSGPRLFAGGSFVQAGSGLASCIAQWDGTSWAPLGLGLDASSYDPFVFCLGSFDLGSGPALYAGGGFQWAGNVQASCIAKWNGSAWSALGSGVNGAVYSCAAFDDGSGPALYVGGDFNAAGGLPISYIARWNGSNWSSVGAPLDGYVSTLQVIDDGYGPELYAGGSFRFAGSVALDCIGKWDGTAWQPVGAGFPPGHSVWAITWYDDGSGPALFVSDTFLPAGGVVQTHIVKWGGFSWLPVGGGITSTAVALTLTEYDAGADRGLYVGGFFDSAGPTLSSNIAKWAFTPDCGQPAVEICFPGTGGVTPCPCGNPPVILGTGCDNSSGTGGAVLWATGQASLSYDTVLLRVNGERPTATSLVLQGSSALFPGAIFGQGVRCVSGVLKRLYVKTAVSGSIAAPVAGDLTIAARSAELGDTIPTGAHRFYGVYYRDPNILGGCPATSGFNITQQLDILWTP